MLYWLVDFGITGLACELYFESFWWRDYAKIYSLLFVLSFSYNRWLFILFVFLVNFLGVFLGIFSFVLLILRIFLEVGFIVNFWRLFWCRFFFFFLFLYIVQGSQEILIHLFYKCNSINKKSKLQSTLYQK